jgi:hypothetical protein
MLSSVNGNERSLSKMGKLRRFSKERVPTTDCIAPLKNVLLDKGNVKKEGRKKKKKKM